MNSSSSIIGTSVSFITMGCAKNEVDSEHMMQKLSASGYEIIDDPENADVVIVNTCSFIQAATEESIDAILEVAGFDSVMSGESKLIVAGCMPSRYGEDLAAEIPEASRFVTCSKEDDIVNIIDSVLGIERLVGEGIGVSLSTPVSTRVFAYVKISDGCDRFCSYCTIPYIRGRYHSFTFESIQQEVQRVVNEGAREIVLIAQDTGRWGKDLSNPSSLADLMSKLANQWPEIWFRVMYVQPEGITDDLIEAIASHENICNYFDIPLQHVNTRILSAMNRKGSAESFLQLVQRIRARIPDATLRTTLIAGFPGESDDDFQELCDFIEEAELDYIGVFAYSREEGTRAYDLPNQIDEDEKLARTQALRDLADAVCTPRVAERIGSNMNILICGREEDGQLFGRAMCQAPDVDGVTYVENCEIGDIVSVCIEDTLLYEMEGTVMR